MFRHGIEFLEHLIREEIKSPPGRLDLLGGVAYIAVVLLILTEAFFFHIGAALAALVGRHVESEFGPLHLLVMIMFIPIYFLLSVQIVTMTVRK